MASLGKPFPVASNVSGNYCRVLTGITQFKVPMDLKIGTLDSLMVRA